MSVQAQKGNKILRISEDAIERYLGMGYNIVGLDGAVLQKAVPSDNNQLKLEYSQLSKEVESLKATIQTLEMKNKSLVQENKQLADELEKAKTSKTVEVKAEVVDDSESKKTTRKRKQTTEEEKAE